MIHDGPVLVPVFVQRWQHECCGAPFEVGSRVEWRLGIDQEAFWATALGQQAPSWRQRLPVIDPAPSPEQGPHDVVVGSDGLFVFVRRDSAPATDLDSVVVSGPLMEDHHVDVPQKVSPTKGVVRRIRTVHQGYQDSTPRPGDTELVNTTAAQRWNPDGDDGRRFVGFLVDLDVSA